MPLKKSSTTPSDPVHPLLACIQAMRDRGWPEHRIQLFLVLQASYLDRLMPLCRRSIHPDHLQAALGLDWLALREDVQSLSSLGLCEVLGDGTVMGSPYAPALTGDLSPEVTAVLRAGRTA